MSWGLLFVVVAVVAGWPIQVVTIVVIFGLFVLFDDLEGGIGLDAAIKYLHSTRKAPVERK